MTVMIMGVAFSAILGGVATSILMSDIHRKQASSQTILRSYAEAVEGPKSGWTWPGCSASLTSYSTSNVGYTLPAAYGGNYTPSVTGVKFWDGSSSFQPTCPMVGGSPKDYGLQQISLSVASSDGRAIETLDVVKRCTDKLLTAGGTCP